MSTPTASRGWGRPLRVRGPFGGATRSGRLRALRAPPPSPRPAPAPGDRSRRSGAPRAPHLFQCRHQQPPPLGRVLLAEKLVRQLLRLHGAPGAPLGGERGGGGRAREPRKGELAARNRAAAPPDGPAPTGRSAAGLAPARRLGGEARTRPPTRHRNQPRGANVAQRRRRRHPAPPPRGSPPPLPEPPSAAAAAAATGLRSRAGRAWPAAERAAGGGSVEGAPAAAPARPVGASRAREPPGGTQLGRGPAGEEKGPRSLLGDRCPELPPRRRRRRCSTGASY
jgi:hypothetical protein